MSKKRKKSKSNKPAGNMPLIRAIYTYHCDKCGREREIQIACGVDEFSSGDPVVSPGQVPCLSPNCDGTLIHQVEGEGTKMLPPDQLPYARKGLAFVVDREKGEAVLVNLGKGARV